MEGPAHDGAELQHVSLEHRRARDVGQELVVRLAGELRLDVRRLHRQAGDRVRCVLPAHEAADDRR